MTKSLEEFIGKYQHPSDKEAMRIAIKEALRVCEEFCNEEIRRKEYSPGGHPMNVVDIWGHIHSANDLLNKLKSWAGE